MTAFSLYSVSSQISIPGLSPPQRNLASFVIKFGDLGRLFEAEPSATNASVDENIDWLQRVRDYSQVKSSQRDPTQFLEARAISEWLADILRSQHYAIILGRAFGDSFYALQQAVSQTVELRKKCDPRATAARSFSQYASMVGKALGFEGTILGVRRAAQEIAVAVEQLRDGSKQPGEMIEVFNIAARILQHLLAFYFRAMPDVGSQYRAKLCDALSAMVDKDEKRALDNFRSHQPQLGDLITILAWVDESLWARYPGWLEELQRQFWGSSRPGFVDQTEWKRRLRKIALGRSAIAHETVRVKPGTLAEYGSGFDDRQLRITPVSGKDGCPKWWEVELTEDQKFILVETALLELQAFCAYLDSDKIYPEIQQHEAIEITRLGEAFLMYFDEFGLLQTIPLDGQRDFSRDFYPGEFVFFRHLANGMPYWMPVSER